ncbi:MazG-like family protein [Bacillus sp. 1P02SD]|uniref:MazG-like family protein n=1 Tax=Bacillus sp. 1P02SD TaxID=3132264 RepID=UPI0039A063C0
MRKIKQIFRSIFRKKRDIATYAMDDLLKLLDYQTRKITALQNAITNHADSNKYRAVINDVALERLRQNSKWGKQRHDLGTWLQILIEEVGEVAQAMQASKGWGKDTDAQDLYNELIQVSAVAVAIAEQIREEMGLVA